MGSSVAGRETENLDWASDHERIQAQIGKPIAGDTSYQTDLPVFDPSEETITFLGKTFSLKDNRIGSHFESYLLSVAHKEKDAQEYVKAIKQIQKILQQGSGYRNKVATAKQLLKVASDYKGDHNVSESLGVAIRSAEIDFFSPSF